MNLEVSEPSWVSHNRVNLAIRMTLLSQSESGSSVRPKQEVFVVMMIVILPLSACGCSAVQA